MANEMLGPGNCSRDSGIECHCDCHSSGSGSIPAIEMKHCMPCCSTMSCGAHINFGFEETHVASCDTCQMYQRARGQVK